MAETCYGPLPVPKKPRPGRHELSGPEACRIVGRLRLQRWCSRKGSHPLAYASHATAMDLIRKVTRFTNYRRQAVSDDLVQEELAGLQREVDTRYQIDLLEWQQQRAHHLAVCDELRRDGFRPCEALYCDTRLWVRRSQTVSTMALLLCPGCVERGVSHRCRQCGEPVPSQGVDGTDNDNKTRCSECETLLCQACQSAGGDDATGLFGCEGCYSELCAAHFDEGCAACRACHKPCDYCRSKACCDQCATVVHSGVDDEDSTALACDGCSWRTTCSNCRDKSIMCDVCAVCHRTVCGPCPDDDRSLAMAPCLRCSATVCRRLPHGRRCRLPYNGGVLCPPCATAVRGDLEQAVANTDAPLVPGIVRLVVSYCLATLPTAHRDGMDLTEAFPGAMLGV